MFQSDLPNKFLRLRKFLDYNQENMAMEIGISPEAYGKIERGKTSISEERLRQISKVFGFEPWEMLQFSAEDLLILLIKRASPPQDLKEARTG